MKRSTPIVTLTLAALCASAANLTWIGGAQGDWNTASNWDPNQVPTQSDTVFFDSTERITVNLGATQALATLSVSNTPCLMFTGESTGSELQVRQDSKSTSRPASISPPPSIGTRRP